MIYGTVWTKEMGELVESLRAAGFSLKETGAILGKTKRSIKAFLDTEPSISSLPDHKGNGLDRRRIGHIERYKRLMECDSYHKIVRC
jgi:hypothetical protein